MSLNRSWISWTVVVTVHVKERPALPGLVVTAEAVSLEIWSVIFVVLMLETGYFFSIRNILKPLSF